MFLPRLPGTCFSSMTRVDFDIPIFQPNRVPEQDKNRTGGQRDMMSTLREIPGGDRCQDPE